MDKAESNQTENTPESDAKRNKLGHFGKGNTIGNRWEKGVSGNEAGRPKRRHLTDALLKHMKEKASTLPFAKKAAINMGLDPEEITNYEVLMMSAMLHGIKGKGEILKQIWERVEGAVPKSLSLDFDDPVQVYIAEMERATAPTPDDDTDNEDEGDSADTND